MSTSLLVDVLLLVLLGATLIQAVRLERALGSMRRDRAELERTIAEFESATRQAEAGLERLRGSAEGTLKQIARQIDQGGSLRQDLEFLAARGEKLADRLELLVQLARTHADTPAAESTAPRRSEAERDLLRILQAGR